MADVDPDCGCPITRAAREADARAAQARVKAAGVPTEVDVRDAPVTVVTPGGPGTFGRLPTMEPIAAPSGGNRVAECSTRTREGFWLRPTPTFDHVGPHFPRDTMIRVLAQTEFARGRFRLYRVSVLNPADNGATRLEGFAALAVDDLLLGTCSWVGSNSILLFTYGRKAP